VALTAFARAEDEQRALAAGYQRRLTKPVQANLLVREIAALVANRESRAKETAKA
jgi:CheY-like chemotaxis protein